jgi:hypothetical protein
MLQMVKFQTRKKLLQQFTNIRELLAFLPLVNVGNTTTKLQGIGSGASSTLVTQMAAAGR